MTDSPVATDEARQYSKYWTCRNCGAMHQIFLRDLPNRTCPQCGMQQNINEEIQTANTTPTTPVNEAVEDRKFLIWALANKWGHAPTIKEAAEFLEGDFATRKRLWMRGA